MINTTVGLQNIKNLVRSVLSAVALLAFCLTATAQQHFPDKPLRLVVGFASGAVSDILARILAEQLSISLGQPVVVDNKPGALASLSAAQVAQSPADGYTLLFGTNTNMSGAPAGLLRNVPYDPFKDFTPLGRAFTTSTMLMGSKDVPAKTMPELIAYIRKNPGKISCGTSNASSLVWCEWLKQQSADLIVVNYKSGSQALTDLMGGQIKLMFVDVSNGAPRAKSGQLIAYNAAGASRTSAMPELPSMAEAGMKNLPNLDAWGGLFAPAGLPKSIADRLTSDLMNLLAKPDVQSRMNTIGVDVAPSLPPDFERYMRVQYANWQKAVKDYRLSPEN